MSANISPKHANILIVDDTPENLLVLGQILSEAGYTVRPATNGYQAIQAAKLLPPDLIVLDILMPEMDGIEVCTQLKQEPSLRDIPVIFISAVDNVDQKLQAFEVGGLDYITKPFHNAEVLARINTHLELAHLRLQQMHVELETARRQLNNRFIIDVSHEFRTPLSIIGVAAHMIQRFTSDNRIHTNVIKIQRSIDEMTALLNTMIKVMRLETELPNLEPVNLNHIVQSLNIVNVLRSEPTTSQALQLKLADRLPPIDGSPEYLDDALSEIIHNAVRFSADDRVITIETATDYKRVFVHITDNGIGMSEDVQKRIFESFYREDAAHQRRGMGLGLTIVKRIVALHNGAIQVTSELGGGSCFTLSFPAIEVAASNKTRS